MEAISQILTLNEIMNISPSLLRCRDVNSPNTLLYNLRRAFIRVAQNNATEYITPYFALTKEDTKVHSETIYNIEVPLHYSEEMWSETVEVLTDTTSDLDEQYTLPDCNQVWERITALICI